MSLFAFFTAISPVPIAFAHRSAAIGILFYAELLSSGSPLHSFSFWSAATSESVSISACASVSCRCTPCIVADHHLSPSQFVSPNNKDFGMSHTLCHGCGRDTACFRLCSLAICGETPLAYLAVILGKHPLERVTEHRLDNYQTRTSNYPSFAKTL